MIEEPSQPADRAVLAPAAALFHGLSDAGRLALLRRLVAEGPRVVDLNTHIVAQSTVCMYRGSLRDCDLLDVRAHDQAPVYCLTHADLLAAAETLLAASGDAVALGAGHGDAQNKPRRDTADPSSCHEEHTR